MRKPVKPGSEASKTQEGGALGNIDEQRGHPGKGTGGDTVRQSEKPDPDKGTQQKVGAGKSA